MHLNARRPLRWMWPWLLSIDYITICHVKNLNGSWMGGKVGWRLRKGNKVFEVAADVRTRSRKGHYPYAKNCARKIMDVHSICMTLVGNKKQMLEASFEIKQRIKMPWEVFKSKMPFFNCDLGFNRSIILMRMCFAMPVDFKNLLTLIFKQYNFKIRFFRWNRVYNVCNLVVAIVTSALQHRID